MLRRLLLILIAAVTFSSSVWSAELLGADQLGSELGGHTIKGYYTHTRVGFVEVYLADGRISYKDDLKADVGKWSVQDGAFCTFYDRINGACWHVLKRSVNCYEFFPVRLGAPAMTIETLLAIEPDARAARDGETVSCEAWFGS
jgi:hypothetical protein